MPGGLDTFLALPLPGCVTLAGFLTFLSLNKRGVVIGTALGGVGRIQRIRVPGLTAELVCVGAGGCFVLRAVIIAGPSPGRAPGGQMRPVL